ncbi:OmpA family protein [uncultured Thiodictyon sp.]|uniref:OmpA family protein n=1 Tax=uncultured Thiodictyon sp. TaxID=1846217 RepID=UPI0025F4F021|nr:OmpA family protein [uncultured Thiodictyon sp.]
MKPKPFVQGIALALALALLPLLVRATDCDQGAQLYEQALASADPADKTRLLERSVQACPETLAYYQLGVARLASNEPQAAAAALRQALGLADNDPQVQGAILGRQAQASLALGEVAEALAAADTARALFARAATGAGAGQPASRGLAAGPAWFTGVQRTIDQSPERQAMSAETIGRFFTAQRGLGTCRAGQACGRGFDPRPRLDLYILFDTNQDQPNAAGLKAVAELGRYLAGTSRGFDPRPRPGPGTAPGPSPDAGMVGLIGHTDQCAEDAFNQDLSERRARQVAALIERDYPQLRGRLRSEGRGEREPRYPAGNQRPDCDQPLNRRVAVVLPQ